MPLILTVHRLSRFIKNPTTLKTVGAILLPQVTCNPNFSTVICAAAGTLTQRENGRKKLNVNL